MAIGLDWPEHVRIRSVGGAHWLQLYCEQCDAKQDHFVPRGYSLPELADLMPWARKHAHADGDRRRR